MTIVTVRDLRNHGGEVLDRVARGEHVVVTRDGRPVAELRQVVGEGVAANVLIGRWRHAPHVDAAAFRRDIDDLLDASL